LASYKNLEEADFSANELMSLSGIEKCTNLRYIDLEGNPIVDYSPLIKLPNLKEINVTNVNDPNLNVLKAARLDLIIK